MFRVISIFAFVFVALATGHPTSKESSANTTTVPSNSLPGPCPNLTTIVDLNVTRFHTFWYKVYQSYFHGDPVDRCTKANFTILPDKSIVSFYEGILQGQSELTQENVTLTPINDFPGTFDITFDAIAEVEGYPASYQNVTERRSYILDTDYETYIYSGCCYGDGFNYHKIASGVMYYEKQIPNETITAAYNVFRHYEFPLNLNPVDQENCTSVQHD